MGYNSKIILHYGCIRSKYFWWLGDSSIVLYFQLSKWRKKDDKKKKQPDALAMKKKKLRNFGCSHFYFHWHIFREGEGAGCEKMQLMLAMPF